MTYMHIVIPVLQKFDLVPEDGLIVDDKNMGIAQSTSVKTLRKTFLECIDGKS